MKEQHIILRTTWSATRDVFRAAVETSDLGTRGGGALKIESESLDRRGVLELAQSRDVVAVAPAIPVSLVNPVPEVVLKNFDLAPYAGDGVSWGIGAVKADLSPDSGEGVVVAVLDTGIDKGHPAFAGVEICEKDFTGQGNGDNLGHGTHCAGTIFGRDLAGIRIGLARGIRKALIGKVIGTNGGDSLAIANAINWAAEGGANIISMSLGIDFPGLVDVQAKNGMPTGLATSRALESYRANVHLFETLARYIEQRSRFAETCIVVAAAGNESRRDLNPDYVIGVSPPAISEGIMSVAALGKTPEGLRVADFSNTGANIAAPGVSVLSAKTGGGTQTLSGTSMATPHVAGVAALWLDRLRKSGQSVTSAMLTRWIVGSAQTDVLCKGTSPADVGVGLAVSPQ